MSKLQTILYLLIIVALIVLIIVTWGSIASAVFAFGLIYVGPIYLMQRFVLADRGNDFIEDDNV